jgi:Zn-dependent peptidase ImmA (M78 family)
MKLHWRVSMQALIRRARDLERITENQYRYLCTQISKEGYRTNEPEPIPPEQPSVVPDLITTYQQHYGYTIAQLSAMVHSHEDHFRMLLMNEEQPRLKLHSG